MPNRRSLLVACLAAAVAIAAPTAEAAWPNDKPIEMIVAYPAGGGTDIGARTLQVFLEKYLKASVVVVNRAGAGGEVGFTALAMAKPDGYTIGMVNSPVALTIPIERKARYALSDFEPIANIVDDYSALSVHVDSPYKTVAELVEFARKNPGAVTIASTGIGSDDHLGIMYLEKAAGAKFTHVPFTGTAPARTALLGRHITAAALNIGEVTAFAGDSAKLRVLGIMAAKRWADRADVPTFGEQGFDVIMSSQRGLAAPKGTPKEIVDRIAAAVAETMKDPDFIAKARQQILPLDYKSAQEWSAELQKANAQYQEVWRTTPWQPK